MKKEILIETKSNSTNKVFKKESFIIDTSKQKVIVNVDTSFLMKHGANVPSECAIIHDQVSKFVKSKENNVLVIPEWVKIEMIEIKMEDEVKSSEDIISR